MKQTRYTALIVPAGILCIAVLLFAYRLMTPFDGVQLVPGAWNFTTDGVQVAPLENQSDGVQEGDLVVAVAGRNLDSWAQGLFDPQAVRPSWEAGQVITYTVVRAGQRIDIPVKLTRYPFVKLLNNHWSNWLIIAVFAVLAAFIFLQRPDNRSIRILLLWISCLIGDLVFWTVGLQVSDIVMGAGFWLQSIAQHFAFHAAFSHNAATATSLRLVGSCNLQSASCGVSRLRSGVVAGITQCISVDRALDSG